MHDYYLRSTNQTTMTDSLVEAGLMSMLVHDDGRTERFVVAGTTVAHIGPLAWLEYASGEVIAKSDPRWHTNLRTEIPLEDAQLAVLPILDPPPSNPVRRFFDAPPTAEPENGPSDDAGA